MAKSALVTLLTIVDNIGDVLETIYDKINEETVTEAEDEPTCENLQATDSQLGAANSANSRQDFYERLELFRMTNGAEAMAIRLRDATKLLEFANGENLLSHYTVSELSAEISRRNP